MTERKSSKLLEREWKALKKKALFLFQRKRKVCFDGRKATNSDKSLCTLQMYVVLESRIRGKYGVLLSREPRQYLKSLRSLFTAAKKKRVYSGNTII